jgi:hypothetical protein
MPPVLRPRTPGRGTPTRDASRGPRGASPPAGGEPPGPKLPPPRSFALSSSGWLFVYYVGVVKALAERGYDKCVALETALPSPAFPVLSPRETSVTATAAAIRRAFEGTRLSQLPSGNHKVTLASPTDRI